MPAVYLDTCFKLLLIQSKILRADMRHCVPCHVRIKIPQTTQMSGHCCTSSRNSLDPLIHDPLPTHSPGHTKINILNPKRTSDPCLTCVISNEPTQLQTKFPGSSLTCAILHKPNWRCTCEITLSAKVHLFLCEQLTMIV